MNARIYRRGFTLVEVLIVTVVVTVIASITTISYGRTQADARDNTRAAHAALVAAALEKYYDEHGEYPSPRALASTYGVSGDTVATTLSLTDKTTVLMPKASSGTTNSITDSLSTNDVLAYTATSTVGNDNCQTNAQAGCEAFTLQYKKESDGSTVTITSTNHTRPDDNTSPLEAPNKPTLAATQSGATIVATSSSTACATNPAMTANYSFRVQVGAGAWSAWSSWQTSTTYTTSGPTNGTTYSYQVHTRCATASQFSDTSVDSDVASVTYYAPPSAPATPSVSVSPANGTVATSATGSIGAASCNYGTVQYAIDYRTNDGSWTSGTWGSSTTQTVNAIEGTKYGFRATARCVNGTQTSTSGTSAEATTTTAVATPGAPSVSGSGPTWSWTPSACSAGSSPYYYYQFSYWNGSGWVAQTAQTWINGNSVTNPAATSQGITYGINVWQYCWSGNVNSAWSAMANGGTFVVPVSGSQLVKWAMRMDTGSYVRIAFNTFSAECASGTVREMYITAEWNNVSPFADVTGWFNVNTGDTKLMNMKALSSSGDEGEFWPRSRCNNNATGVVSGTISRLYNVGNIYNLGSSKYNISCGWGSAGDSWCSGGYDSGGTKNSSSSSLLACGVRSGGIENSDTRWTPKLSFGTGSACWSA